MTIKTDAKQTATRERWITVGICLALVAIVWIVFGQTLRFDFVNFDDNENIFMNPDVMKGLDAHSFAYAFTHTQIGHWDPLTTLSHMLDSQLYGSGAGGRHLTNVLLHTVSSVLLFLLLRGMTGAAWRSAFVAAVFAIHPLRAESVAWISERKDTLSGVFFILTMWAYWRYTIAKYPALWYAAALLLFALGLMAKSMLVTLPFVLILLDYWPLRRLELPAAGPAAGQMQWIPWRLVREKIPFLFLAILSCGAALLADKSEVEIHSHAPLALRAGNTVISYAIYLRQMFYPVGLIIPYQRPDHSQPAWEIALAVITLAVISTAVFAGWRKYPFLAIGWLWYLGMLVPVVGVVETGLQSHADRYTYLPQIGISIMIAWGACELAGKKTLVLGALGAGMVALLMWCAVVQVSYWKDNFTLWPHTLLYDVKNDIAYANLGYAFAQASKWNESAAEFEKSLALKEIVENRYNYGLVLAKMGNLRGAMIQYQMAIAGKPDYPEALNNLGHILQIEGDLRGAMGDYQRAVDLKPDYPEARNNLGNMWMFAGQIDKAIEQYTKAIDLKPDYAEAMGNLGVACAQRSQWDAAIVQYKKALKFKSNDMKILDNLAIALAQKGDFGGAIEQYETALKFNPDYADAQAGLAYVLATAPDAKWRDGARAADLAQKANQTAHSGDPDILDALSAAFAEQGRYQEAVDAVYQALHIAQAQGDANSVDHLQQHLQLYRAGKPLRDNR